MNPNTTDAPTNISESVYISVNIGPGPNSTAFLRVEGGTLSLQERGVLREIAQDEDGFALQHVGKWLSLTGGITLTLSGAHHEIESFDPAEGESEPVHGCVFCGSRYRWAIRCSGNPEGLI